jgi:hypothetical protein
MLEWLATVEVRTLADKACAARKARDRMLAGVRDMAFGEPKPARGEHNPAAAMGLNALPESDPHRRALVDALSALPPPARRELWALVLIGRGDYGLKDWDRAISEANRLSDTDASLFLEHADLHEHLMKAVYEIERTSGAMR